jgi:hypothetical protein
MLIRTRLHLYKFLLVQTRNDSDTDSETDSKTDSHTDSETESDVVTALEWQGRRWGGLSLCLSICLCLCLCLSTSPLCLSLHLSEVYYPPNRRS